MSRSRRIAAVNQRKAVAHAMRARPTAGAAAAPAPSVWMVSPAFDLTFFVATALVVLIPWLAIERWHVSPFVVVAGVAISSNGPHLISTWTRVYLDGNERFRRPLHYWLVPAAITGAVLTLLFVEGRFSPTLRTVLLYWAWWHFMMQNWGILRIYQRRDAASSTAGQGRSNEVKTPTALLERAVLTIGAIWPLAVRLYTGPWGLFGAQIKHPKLQAWQVNAVGALFAAVAGVYVIVLAARFVQGRKVAWIRPLVIASSCFGFYVPFVMIRKSGSAGFAAAACWHGLQYLGIVWFYNRNRWKAGVDRKARLVSWVSQPRRAPFYFLSLLAIAGIVYGGILLAARLVWDPETWGSVVWMSLTFGHYWLDGVIWKLRKPELQKQLITASA